MTDRPTILPPTIIRAALDGRVSRVVVPVKPALGPEASWHKWEGECWRANGLLGDIPIPWRSKILYCPFGGPGDRLYVRESYDIVDDPAAYDPKNDGPRLKSDYQYSDVVKRGPNNERWVVDYKADVNTRIMDLHGGRRWKSPATMPRWAARLWFAIRDVSVVRVGDVTMEQIKECGAHFALRAHFAADWDKRFKSFPWASNPWAWNLEVEVVK